MNWTVALWLASGFREVMGWLPIALSLIATGISVLAYRRSAPPILPKVWLSLKGRGREGVTLTLHVENHTAHPVRIDSIRPRSGRMKIAKPPSAVMKPEKPWEFSHFTETEWLPSLSLDFDVQPNGSSETGIVLPITDTNVIASPSMHLCISTMRRTIRKRAIVVPIIIPAAT